MTVSDCHFAVKRRLKQQSLHEIVKPRPGAKAMAQGQPSLHQSTRLRQQSLHEIVIGLGRRPGAGDILLVAQYGENIDRSAHAHAHTCMRVMSS